MGGRFQVVADRTRDRQYKDREDMPTFLVNYHIRQVPVRICAASVRARVLYLLWEKESVGCV